MLLSEPSKKGNSSITDGLENIQFRRKIEKPDYRNTQTKGLTVFHGKRNISRTASS